MKNFGLEKPKIIEPYRKYFESGLFKEYFDVYELYFDLQKVVTTFNKSVKIKNLDFDDWLDLNIGNFNAARYNYSPVFGGTIKIPFWSKSEVQEPMYNNVNVCDLTLDEVWTSQQIHYCWSVIAHELGHRVQLATSAVRNMNYSEVELNADRIMMAFWKDQPKGMEKLEVAVMFDKDIFSKIPEPEIPEGVSVEDYFDANYHELLKSSKGLVIHKYLHTKWEIDIFENEIQELNLKNLTDELKDISIRHIK